jgi:hypothetical protein
MARRRTHRRRHHSRRRIGAIKAGSAIKKVAGIAAGVFAGRLIVTKVASTMDPKIANAIPLVVGFFVPKFLKGDIGEGIGDGLIAAGTLGLLQNLNVVSGIGYASPGQSAFVRTGANMYNPHTARTVGAPQRYPTSTPQPGIMNRAVGTLNGMPRKTLTRLGALLEE